jgi:HK97 family phage major capsid protein
MECRFKDARNGAPMKKKQLLEQLAALKAKREALTAVAEPDNITEHLAATKAAIAEEAGVQEQLDAYAEMEKLAKANVSRQPAVVLSDNEAKRPFENFGEQLFAIACAQSPRGSFQGQGGTIDKRLMETNLAASGMNSTVGTEGGFLMQTDFSTAILAKAAELGRIAPGCFTIPISEGFDGVELPYIDETSRATGSRWGGVRVYRAAETDAPTSSKPKINRMELKLESLKGLAYVSERQIRNSAATSAILQNAFSSEFAFVKDNEIWRGTGVGECLGFATQAHEGTALLVQVAKKAAQTAATFVIENATAMLSRLYADPGDTVEWLLNRDCIGQLPLMTIGQQPVFLPNNNAAGSPYYGTLFGYPIRIVEQAETLGTAGDVVLANKSKYALIEQGGLRSATSMHVRFIYDEMAFKWSHDFNGQCIVKKPITPFKGSNTLSPFVTTAVRA